MISEAIMAKMFDAQTQPFIVIVPVCLVLNLGFMTQKSKFGGGGKKDK